MSAPYRPLSPSEIELVRERLANGLPVVGGHARRPAKPKLSDFVAYMSLPRWGYLDEIEDGRTADGGSAGVEKH